MTELTTTAHRVPTAARGRRLAAMIAVVLATLVAGAWVAPAQASASATGGTQVTANVTCSQPSNVIDIKLNAWQWSTSSIMMRHRILVWDLTRQRWVHVSPYGFALVKGSESVQLSGRLSLPDGAYQVIVQADRWDYNTYTPLQVHHNVTTWAWNGAPYKSAVCYL